jgi:hypothetical protein
MNAVIPAAMARRLMGKMLAKTVCRLSEGWQAWSRRSAATVRLPSARTLKLRSVTRLEHDILHLRYQVT